MTARLTYLTNGGAIGPSMTADAADAAINALPGLLWRVRGERHFRTDRGTGQRKLWDLAKARTGYVTTDGIAVTTGSDFGGKLRAVFGTGDRVALPGLMPTNGNPFTLIAVARCASADGAKVLFGGTYDNEWFELRINGNTMLMSIQGSPILNPGITFDPTVPFVAALSMEIVGGNQQFTLELNGALYGSPVPAVNDSAHQNNAGTIYIGQLAGAGGFQLIGDLAEAAGFGDLSNADRAATVTHLKSRYAIS